jgi:hypothetical protein
MQLERPFGKLSPAQLRSRLQEDLRRTARDIASARGDLRRFADPGALKAWLQAELAAEQRRPREPFEPFDRA